MGASTGTSSPSVANCASNVPAAVDSTSKAALSVSISQSTSPVPTRSPGCLSQRTMVHASTDCPCRGITISVAM